MKLLFTTLFISVSVYVFAYDTNDFGHTSQTNEFGELTNMYIFPIKGSFKLKRKATGKDLIKGIAYVSGNSQRMDIDNETTFTMKVGETTIIKARQGLLKKGGAIFTDPITKSKIVWSRKYKRGKSYSKQTKYGFNWMLRGSFANSMGFTNAPPSKKRVTTRTVPLYFEIMRIYESGALTNIFGAHIGYSHDVIETKNSIKGKYNPNTF